MLLTCNWIIRIAEFILRMKVGAIAIFPFILVPHSARMDATLLNHEKIHLRQQLELLIIPFYIWYVIAFFRKGYLNISFEKEAYMNEKNQDYLKTRKPYSFRSYL